MPTEIDALQLGISANTKNATKHIDGLIESLNRLDRNLNLSNISNYSSAISDISMGMLDLSHSINSINADKLKDVVKSISGLSKAGSMFSNLASIAGGMNKAFEPAIRMGQSLNGIKTDKTVDEIEEEISALEMMKESAEESKKALRDALKKENFSIPKDIWKEYPEEAKHMRANMGINNTSNQDYDYTERLKEVARTNIGSEVADRIGTQVDGFRELSQYIDDMNTAIENSSVSLERLNQELQYARQHAQEMAKAVSSVGDGDSFMDMPFDATGMSEEELLDAISSMSEATAPIQEVTSAVENLDTAMQNISQTNPFVDMAEGLRSLEGINISADQLSGLTALKDVIGKMGGSYAATAAQTLPQIAEGLRAFSGVTVPHIEGITEFAAQLSAFGSAANTRTAGNLAFIAEGLTQLAHIPPMPNTEGISELAHSIAQFGYAGAQRAVETLPQLTVAFNNLITTLSRAPHVSQNTIDLANAMANLASQGGRAGAAVNAMCPRLNRFTSSAGRAAKAGRGLAQVIGKVYATYWLLFRALGKIKGAIDYASQLTEIQNVVDTVFGDMSGKLQDFSDRSIMDFGMSELSAKQFASRYQAIGSAMGITSQSIASANEYLNGVLDKTKRHIDGVADSYSDLGDSMADMSINLTKLAADMGSFYNMDYADVADDLASVYTGMTRPLRQYGLDLTEATLKEWAMKNGMDANIKSMSQAEKTMLRYQYVMANMGHVMNDYAITANTWANVTRTIGQQFQKLGSLIGTGFINALKPALIRFRDFMNILIDLVEKGLNAIGKLLGWQVEISEVGTTMDEGMADYADSVGDAAGNAKKLKDYLLGIDELNVLNPDDGSGSGGGSGASGGGGGASQVTDSVVSVKPYESDIDSWFELGQAIRDKIVDGLNSIDWAGIQQRVKENAKHFAELLNGLFSPDENDVYVLGKAIGHFLAEALNTAVDWFLTFATTFNWEDLGHTIAAGINEFFATFDFKDLANTIDAWVQGIWTTIKTAIDDIDWGKIWDDVKDFIKEIDVQTLALSFAGVSLYYGKKLLTSGILKDLILGKLAPLASAAGLTTGAAAGGILLFTAEIVIAGVIIAKEAKEWFNDIKEYGWNGGREKYRKDNDASNPYTQGRAVKQEDGSGSFDRDFFGFAPVIEARKKEIEDFSKWVDGVKDKWGELKEQIVSNADASAQASKQFTDDTATNFNNMSSNIDDTMAKVSGWFDSEKWQEFGQSIKDGLETKWNEFSEWWQGTGIPGWWDEHVAPWFTVDRWMELGQSIKDGIAQKWDEFKEWWNTEGLGAWWEENVAPWFSFDTWYEMAQGIYDGLIEKWNETTEQWGIDIQNWWNTKVAPWFTLDKWKTTVKTIKDSIKQTVDETVEQWHTDLTAWWNNHVAPWFTAQKWNSLLSNIAPAFKKAFKDGANGAISALNKVIEGAETMVNQAIAALNSLFQAINPLLEAASKGSISLAIPNVTLPRIPQFMRGGYIPAVDASSYSLFAAGENGIPEMLGTVGGRSAVAGGEEITGIRSAIEASSERESLLMQRLIEVEETLIAVVEDKELTIGDEDIATANLRGQKMMGYQLRMA